jgi:hypothetical protein
MRTVALPQVTPCLHALCESSRDWLSLHFAVGSIVVGCKPDDDLTPQQKNLCREGLFPISGIGPGAMR